MKPRLLHSVIDDVLIALEQWPELGGDVMRFVFDESHAIREGLCDARTRHDDGKRHPDGTVSFGVGVELLASRQLIEFASAISQGFVPHMPLPGGA